VQSAAKVKELTNNNSTQPFTTTCTLILQLQFVSVLKRARAPSTVRKLSTSIYEGDSKSEGDIEIFLLYDWQHCWGQIML
jgi:hypothetical protein